MNSSTIAAKTTLSLCSLAILFLFSACQERPRPTPDQTMMGDPDYEAGYLTDAERAERAAWEEELAGVDRDEEDWPEDFVLEPRTGLEEREAFGEGEQIRDMFESVYFEFDRSNIRPGERGKIETVADHLRDTPEHNILLEGHCDWRGTTEYNLGLGDRRATSVKEYLLNLGISRDRIEVLSMGDLEATIGGTEAQMAEDRRVEFVLLQ